MIIDNLVQAQLTLITKVAELEGSSLALELDRLIPAKVVVSGTDLYKGFTIDQYNCGKCGRPIGDELMFFNYCPNCGTKVEKV